jgi:lipopolysaccharide transport system ATP-binding protein
MPKNLIDKFFDEIVEFAGVSDFIDTPVKRYSSGMRVRLAFAVAAHLEPDILIVDEVLAVGDAEFQKKCLGRIGDAAKSGRTILFVSHNAAAVENLCTKGIVLSNGRVQFVGSQMEALQFYSDSTDNHSIPLAERTDRKGSGEIRITDIYLTDLSGRKVGAVSPSEGFCISLKYHNSKESEIPNLIAGITIKSHLNVPLINLSNYITGESLGKSLKSSGLLTCQIGGLPLLPSSYNVDFMLLSQPKGAKIIDKLENALNFEVLNKDFYGSGKLPHIGLMMVPATWKVIA